MSFHKLQSNSSTSTPTRPQPHSQFSGARRPIHNIVPIPTFLQNLDPRKLSSSPANNNGNRSNNKIATTLTNVQRRNIQTTTPVQARQLTLHQMAAQGEMHLLVDKLEKKDVDINSQDAQGFSPLLWACANGQKSAVEVLVYSGANIHLTGDNRESCLQLASSFGHQEIVEYLLRAGADVNAVDEVGNSALMFAAYGNHVAVVLALLEWGADFTLENEEGLTAMHIAIKKSSVAAQRILEAKIAELLYKAL